MKKSPLIALAGGLLTVLLGACAAVIVIVALPIDFGAGNQLVVTNARLSTNFYNGNNSNPTYYICDNKTTIITYKFTYNNATFFGGWSSQLRGFASGAINGQASFSASDPRNSVATRTVSVDYLAQPGAVPLNTAGGVSAQAITIVPTPSIIGRTYVDIRVIGINGASDLTGTVGPLQVIDNCP